MRQSLHAQRQSLKTILSIKSYAQRGLFDPPDLIFVESEMLVLSKGDDAKGVGDSYVNLLSSRLEPLFKSSQVFTTHIHSNPMPIKHFDSKNLNLITSILF